MLFTVRSWRVGNFVAVLTVPNIKDNDNCRKHNRDFVNQLNSRWLERRKVSKVVFEHAQLERPHIVRLFWEHEVNRP
jgi:hypothetical protein